MLEMNLKLAKTLMVNIYDNSTIIRFLPLYLFMFSTNY